jgi:HTH-type transcriptional regulator/antitoxin HigA
MGTAKKIIESLQKETNIRPQKVDGTYLELVEFFPLRTITQKKHYEAALAIAEHLIDLKDQGVITYLQTLTDLIADYEHKMFGAMDVSGREMLAYLMELKGLTQMDIAKELGGQGNVSKILKGERELNLRQIRELAARFKVDPAVFI